jgi:hypothetical protein
MSTKASNAYNTFFHQQQTNKSHHKLSDNVDSTEVISDLHLKMSKKIAQLTKVPENQQLKSVS